MSDIWDEIAVASQPAAAAPSGGDIWDEIAAAGAAPRAAQDKTSKTKAALLGAAQGATLNLGDEVGGAIQAGLGSVLPEWLGGYGADDRRTLMERYRSERDAFRAENETAQRDEGGAYLGGQIGGGVLTAALPGAGVKAVGQTAIGTAARTIGAGAGYGALAGAGESGAESWAGTAKDAGKGALIGAAAGAGGAALTSLRRAPGTAQRALGESKRIDALGKFLNGITERGGSPAAQKAAAGRMMDEAIKLAGDAPVDVSRFTALADDIAKSTQNPLSTKLTPVAEEIVGAAERLAGKKNVTLAELSEGLKHWTTRADDLVSDPGAQRIARLAKKALSESLDEASGNQALGKAAELLASGRGAYAKGARAGELQKLLTKSVDPLSKEGFISPRKFATLNSGANRAKIERLFGDDKEALEAWTMGVNAARLMAKKGDSWLPKLVREALPGKLVGAFDDMLTYRGITNVFSNKDTAKQFVGLMTKSRTMKPEAIAASVASIASRLDAAPPEDEENDGEDVVPLPQDLNARAAR